ncbi:hypothetical protein, conserved [Eimeria acervulina]|uniref:Uncharacterized protein n=1 Tax=Eimeria acervulina TaxID=5801 RepID=U6GVK1_EIMAC|nr:hypothetical protein, conserved [Eimeria acervulina]CDI83597.1 hypothetical protein, conserved [Eimeria acervulina]
MFADAVENGLAQVSAGSPLGPPTSIRLGCEGDGCRRDVSHEAGKLLLAALQRLDGVHLLPCHIKYSGLASVEELFKPTRMRPDAAAGEEAGKLEVQLHGRWLRGQEERLLRDNSPSAVAAPKLHGFVVAAQQTTCNLGDLRKSYAAADAADSTLIKDCIEAEEPPSTVTALRPLAEFDKLCYWQQDREPTNADDIPQSLFFLRAMAALHDYQDELKE